MGLYVAADIPLLQSNLIILYLVWVGYYVHVWRCEIEMELCGVLSHSTLHTISQLESPRFDDITF